jgi:hypothetical protein
MVASAGSARWQRRRPGAHWWAGRPWPNGSVRWTAPLRCPDLISTRRPATATRSSSTSFRYVAVGTGL